MRVLVTGHLGFIGTLMVPLLVRAGHEVVGLDTDFYATSAFDEDAIVRVPHVRGDIPRFAPQWTAPAGVKELYGAFVQRALNVEDFEGPRYRRIDRIQNLPADMRLGADLRWRTTSGVTA
jgi:hypothetical protein